MQGALPRQTVATPSRSSPHRSSRGSVVATAVLLGLFIGGGILLWQHLRVDIHAREEYRLDPAKLSVTEPPPWIPADFVEEVLHNGGLDGEVSLLDRRLPERLGIAFQSYPWVAEVQNVRLVHPDAAVVDLRYREPAAMVEIDGGLLPVDAAGVLLRVDYFHVAAPEKAEDFPRIASIRSAPLGSAGSPWGDPAVEAAAALAGQLGKDAKTYGILRIVPEAGSRRDEIFLRLFTAAGTEIHWGTLADPQRKRERLRELCELYGSLDAIPQSQKPLHLD